MKASHAPLLAALWSIAIPGFGQYYNRRYFKGTVLLVLEFIINNLGHINTSIYYSWIFDISRAQSSLNYQWALFYPCIYMFGIFDAYADGCSIVNKRITGWDGAPFVASAFTGTLALIFGSGRVQAGGLERLGPIFLGLIVIMILLGGGSLINHWRHRGDRRSTSK